MPCARNDSVANFLDISSKNMDFLQKLTKDKKLLCKQIAPFFEGVIETVGNTEFQKPLFHQ